MRILFFRRKALRFSTVRKSYLFPVRFHLANFAASCNVQISLNFVKIYESALNFKSNYAQIVLIKH